MTVNVPSEGLPMPRSEAGAPRPRSSDRRTSHRRRLAGADKREAGLKPPVVDAKSANPARPEGIDRDALQPVEQGENDAVATEQAAEVRVELDRLRLAAARAKDRERWLREHGEDDRSDRVHRNAESGSSEDSTGAAAAGVHENVPAEVTSVAEEPVVVKDEAVDIGDDQGSEKPWKPTGRAKNSKEYQQAMERLTTEAKQNGEDIANPKVQERLQKQASAEFYRAYSAKHWRRELTDDVRKRTEFKDAYDRVLTDMKTNLKPGESIDSDALFERAFAEYLEVWDRRPLKKKAVSALKEALKIAAAFLFGSSTETQRKLQEQPGGRR